MDVFIYASYLRGDTRVGASNRSKASQGYRKYISATSEGRGHGHRWTQLARN